MQRPFGPVNGQVHILVAAYAEEDSLLLRKITRTVAADPQVGSKQVLIFMEDLSQMPRAFFFFTLKKEFDIAARFDTAFYQRVVSVDDAHHTGLVVGTAS